MCCRGGYCFSPGLRYVSMIIEALFRRIWKFQRLVWSVNYLGPRLRAEIRGLHFVSLSYILLLFYIRRIGFLLDGLFSGRRLLMFVIICCPHRPTIFAALKGKSSPVIQHSPSNRKLFHWLRIGVYGFSEHLQPITTRPTAAVTLCQHQQQFLGSASLTGTCWEVGPQRAVNDTPGQRNSK